MEDCYLTCLPAYTSIPRCSAFGWLCRHGRHSRAPLAALGRAEFSTRAAAMPPKTFLAKAAPGLRTKEYEQFCHRDETDPTGWAKVLLSSSDTQRIVVP